MSAKRKSSRRSGTTATATVVARSPSPPGDRWRPWLLAATIAVFVARPLLPIESKSLAENGDGMPFVMLDCLLAGLWAVRGLLARKLSIRWGWTDWAVLGLVAWHSASGVGGMIDGAPRPALNVLWEWIGMGLGFLLVRQLVEPGRETRAVLAVMAAVALGEAAYGLYQHFYSLPETRRVYEADPEGAMRLADLPVFRAGSAERRQFEDRLLHSDDAPFATFSLANSLAGFLAAWLIVTLSIAADAWRNARLRPWVLSGATVCLLVEGLCLYLTECRSALVAVVAGVMGLGLQFVAEWQLGRRAKRLIASAVLLAVVAVVSQAVAAGHGLLDGARKSLQYRFEYWRASAEMIADHPLFGVGPGNFQARYTFYKLPQSKEEIQDPHNFLVEVWATAGTPAALLLVTALALFGWKSLARVGEKSPGPSPGAPAAGMDATRYILAGGAAGFVLAWLFGLFTMTGPITEGLMVILPAAAIGTVLLWPWVQAGRPVAGLPLLAAAVLLVNLLAAGGIGFPGVAGSLWLLMAVGLTAAGEGRAPFVAGRGLAGGLLALLAVVGSACYVTGFRPVLVCRADLNRAQADPRYVRTNLEAAAAADPWSDEPWFALAGLQLERWKQDRADESFAEFERMLDHGLKLNPYSSASWLQGGTWSEEAFEASQDERFAGLAAAKFQRAKELYPTSPLHWARLALALNAANDSTAASAKAEALRLHAQTPHADKKLPDELLHQLERIP